MVQVATNDFELTKNVLFKNDLKNSKCHIIDKLFGYRAGLPRPVHRLVIFRIFIFYMLKKLRNDINLFF